MEILRVENVTKHYTGHTALSDVSLSIPRGSIYGLLGPNGAGKTTLIRIINRITAPDNGRVLFDGREIQPSDVERIGYLPEERGLYKKMRVGEQAIYLARLKGLSSAEATARLKEWFVRLGIQSWWNRKVEELSKGMAQKVQFIVTVLHKPELLILDEPFSGFDPINARIIRNEILRLRDEGSTVIFSTHNMASVEEMCDYITLINRSRNILSGPIDQVRRSYGENMYEVEFTGDGDALVPALYGLAALSMHEEPAAPDQEHTDTVGSLHDAGGVQRLKFRLEQGADVRTVVGVINEKVELRSFREIIPSMNDIFLKAVGNSQK